MKEADIRPQALFDEYLALSRRDIETFFSDHSRFVAVQCPACRSMATSDGFTKLGFRYDVCERCRTLYLSPRPTEEMQASYVDQSEAVRFWSTHFYRETAAARREKIFRPRAELVGDLVRSGVAQPGVFVDVGSGYGIFLEEIEKLQLFREVVGVEPAEALAAVCREKGFRIVQSVVEDLTEKDLQGDVATAFEVLEHVFDPEHFLRACGRTLRPGGVLLFTTLTVTGFDLQVLWDRSKSIYPPHHINLLSVEGVRVLVERAGFDLIELSTPGLLDVDIVAGALREDPHLEVPRFVRTLLQSSPEVQEQFQRFLQKAALSSHIRVVARRRGGDPC